MFHIDDVPSGAGEGIKDVSKALAVCTVQYNSRTHWTLAVLSSKYVDLITDCHAVLFNISSDNLVVTMWYINASVPRIFPDSIDCIIKISLVCTH